MAFFPPIPLIRKNIIVKQLHSYGATSLPCSEKRTGPDPDQQNLC